jgi:hypothetical protein
MLNEVGTSHNMIRLYFILTILITNISLGYLNLSLVNEYVGNVTMPNQVIKYNHFFPGRSANQIAGTVSAFHKSLCGLLSVNCPKSSYIESGSFRPGK